MAMRPAAERYGFASNAADAAAQRDQQEIAQAGMVARRSFALRADQRADQQRRGKMRDCIGERKAAGHDFRL